MENISTIEIENASKRVLYTDEEDKRIATYVSNNNYKNLAQALEMFANDSTLNLQNRSLLSLTQRYQRHIKKHHEMFILSNNKGGLSNVKYTPRESEAKYTPAEVIMKQMLELDREVRERVLNFFR